MLRFKPGTVYNREIHFTNFSAYGNRIPKFLTVLRDPVSRFVSRFGFIRQLVNHYDFNIFHWLEPEAVRDNITKVSGPVVFCLRSL